MAPVSSEITTEFFCTRLRILTPKAKLALLHNLRVLKSLYHLVV
jgi:hypothetical protein